MNEMLSAQNAKLSELHALQSVQKDVEDALQTDCDTFAAQQGLQSVQAQLQNLRLEYDFLASNFAFLKHKLETYQTVVEDVCDFLKCTPDQIMQVLTHRECEHQKQSLLLDQLEYTQRQQVDEMNKIQLSQRLPEDLLRSVSQLFKKYHQEPDGVPQSLSQLRLNSEKILEDRNELLE